MRRTMKTKRHLTGTLAAMVAAGLLVAGCGGDDNDSKASSSSSGGSTTTAEKTPDAAAALGTPKKASGDPIVVGLLNIESGPVTFPEYREAAEVAVKYINDYKGGIGGRPVQLETCATDGQPSTS